MDRPRPTPPLLLVRPAPSRQLTLRQAQRAARCLERFWLRRQTRQAGRGGRGWPAYRPYRAGEATHQRCHSGGEPGRLLVGAADLSAALRALDLVNPVGVVGHHRCSPSRHRLLIWLTRVDGSAAGNSPARPRRIEATGIGQSAAGWGAWARSAKWGLSPTAPDPSGRHRMASAADWTAPGKITRGGLVMGRSQESQHGRLIAVAPPTLPGGHHGRRRSSRPPFRRS
jgi:hypothetical protein